tara:strand:+ start:117 stop:521 length:405 start_codon:yes stop_codon:yes gene_type:complete
MGLVDRVKEHEGFRSKVYKCTEGFDTIGYGFAIKDLELTEDVAEMILMQKLDKLSMSVKKAFPWLDNAPPEVEDVLIEMSYQMGLSGVKKFKLALKYMEHQNWDRAADEMLLSRWHRQTPNRAKKLSNVIRALG